MCWSRNQHEADSYNHQLRIRIRETKKQSEPSLITSTIQYGISANTRHTDIYTNRYVCQKHRLNNGKK